MIEIHEIIIKEGVLALKRIMIFELGELEGWALDFLARVPNIPKII